MLSFRQGYGEKSQQLHKAELSHSSTSSPMHCSGPLNAQSRKPRSTDHVSPQQGPEGPQGVWGAIFAYCCQVV